MTTDGLYKYLEKHLTKIENEMHFLRVAIIDYADNNEPLDLYDIDGGRLERKIDILGYMNGWIVDRLKHTNPNSNRGLTHKIRKAQGYNV